MTVRVAAQNSIEQRSTKKATTSFAQGLDRRDPMAFVLRCSAQIIARGDICRGAEARNREGHEVSALSSEAHSFSVVGAILRSCGELCGDLENPQYEGVAEDVHDFLCEYLSTRNLHRWMYSAISKDQVTSMFNDAAERRERTSRLN